MDINIRIIEGVKEFPTLHNNNRNIDERNRAWKQLAEKLEMHEQFLKIRWHSLLQVHQRDANFKYAKWMHFMVRNTERKTNDKENWPEFIITEEYLKDDNPDEQEQFVLLDMDEEDGNTKSFESPKERKCNAEETSKHMKEELRSEDPAKSDIEKEIEVAKVSGNSFETHNRSSPDLEIISSPKGKQCNVSTITTSDVQEKTPAVDVDKQDKISNPNDREMLYEKSHPVIVERCEDVIFGELVSAMLKRMDENKKKNIKREIMNLLFS